MSQTVKERVWFRHTLYLTLLVAAALSFVMGATLFGEGKSEGWLHTFAGAMFWINCAIRRP